MRQRARYRAQFRHQAGDALGHLVHLQAQVIKAVAALPFGQAHAEVAGGQFLGRLGDLVRAAADRQAQHQRADQRQRHGHGNGQPDRGGKGQVEAPLAGAHQPHGEPGSVGQRAGQDQCILLGGAVAPPHQHRLRARARRDRRDEIDVAGQGRRATTGQRDEDAGIGHAAALVADEIGQRAPPAAVERGEQIVAHVDHLVLAIGAHHVEHLRAQEEDRRRARQQLQHEDRRHQPQHGGREAALAHGPGEHRQRRAMVSRPPCDSLRRARCGTAPAPRHRRSCGAGG
jgi:hypothetical protein